MIVVLGVKGHKMYTTLMKQKIQSIVHKGGDCVMESLY